MLCRSLCVTLSEVRRAQKSKQERAKLEIFRRSLPIVLTFGGCIYFTLALFQHRLYRFCWNSVGFGGALLASSST